MIRLEVRDVTGTILKPFTSVDAVPPTGAQMRFNRVAYKIVHQEWEYEGVYPIVRLFVRKAK
jgi:hypothetical protein